MTASCHSESKGGAQLDGRHAGMPKATNRQNPSAPWYGRVRDKDRVTEEPCAVKVACTECAVRRFVASLMQLGGTWRSVPGSPGSPECESARGQEHARKAVVVWRRPG